MLTVKGAELEAKIWGRGEVVVALPGLGADLAYYNLVAPYIAKEGYQLVALNPRGIGRSRGALEELSLDTLAQDVANAIQALGVEEAHLIGWAFGNRVARAVAQNHPEQVSTVILLAAGGLIQPSEDVMAAFLRLSEPGLADSTRIQLLRTSLYSPSSDILAIQEAVKPGTWPETRMAQRAAARAASIDDWWSGGDAPILIVQGRDDVIAPAENGIALQKEFPDRVQLVWVEEAGHMMLVEQPADVADYVVAFLRDHPTRRTN